MDGTKKIKYITSGNISAATKKIIKKENILIHPAALLLKERGNMRYENVHWKIEQILVDPKKATELLETSLGNRSISARSVHRYARDMKLGHWDCAGDGAWITIYEGHLMDAHHRLHAIIESGETIPMMIRIPDVKPKCFDLNKVRSARDIFDMNDGINGHTADGKIITIVRFIWEHLFHIKNSDRATEFDIKDYYEDHDKELSEARRLHEIHTKGMVGLLRNGSCGAAIYAALRYGVPLDVLERFCHIVVTGMYDGSGKETSAIQLRNFIMSYNNTKKKSDGGAAYRIMLCGVTQKAISDFSKGIERKRLYRENDIETCYTDYLREQDEGNYIIQESAENVISETMVKEKKRKEPKRRYGEYGHVQLTQTQYQNLVCDFGENRVKSGIKKVDEYCQVSGKAYKDYNLVLRNWGVS